MDYAIMTRQNEFPTTSIQKQRRDGLKEERLFGTMKFREGNKNGSRDMNKFFINEAEKDSEPNASFEKDYVLTASYKALKAMLINAQDKEGFSALHVAAIQGHVDVVKILLSLHASPFIVDCNGQVFNKV